MKKLIASIIAMVCLFSCQNKRYVENMLDRAESLMQSYPDSSLAIIEGIKISELDTKCLEAKYSLLYSIALDKNYIDLQSDSIISPAVVYYKNHGSNDDKLKTHYYLGRILYNSGKYQEAIKEYTVALDHSEGSSDILLIELIHSAISDIYSATYNFESALEYAKKAYHSAEFANDSLGIWILKGRMASAYAEIRDFKTSDSLYSDFFSKPILDSIVFCENLMNYATTLVLRESPNETEYMEIFDHVHDEFDYQYGMYDWCIYAYCAEISGEKEVTDSIMEQIKETIKIKSPVIDLWDYRIQKHRKNYDTALSLFENSVMKQDSIILATLRQSLVESQKEYYSEKSKRLEQARREERYRYILCLLLVVVILLFVLFLLYSEFCNNLY